MKVKNIAISVAQFGAGCAAGAVSAPFLYVGVAATVVKGVAEIAQTVSFKAVSEITEQFVVVNNKLEAMKVKEAEAIVEEVALLAN
jgi:hypothetical protein